MSEKYVYKGTQPHTRSDGNEVEVIYPGDEVELSDSELTAFRDKFVPADDVNASADDEDEDAADARDDVKDVRSNTDPAADDGTGSEQEYTEGELNAMSYSELREVAKDYDNVSGNVSEYEMRLGLKKEMGYAPDEAEAEAEDSDSESNEDGDEE